MSREYVDQDLIKKYPNKYNIRPRDIKSLQILDWDRLKKKTWFNSAMKKSGNWWCHLEGCNIGGKYNDEDEFWIGFNERNGKIDYHFTCYGGMYSYRFDKFFEKAENKFDFQVQVNALHFLTTLIDEGILGLPVR